MINNYIRLANKNNLKEVQQSAISVIGLAVALSSSILILLYVRYELSYDNFHEYKNQIYRVVTKHQSGNSYMGKDVSTVTPAPLKEVLESVPGIGNAAKCKFLAHTLEYNSSLFSERGFLYADPDFMKIFSFPAITGNPSDLLNEPFALFLTRDMAARYFGNADPIGKTIIADNKYLFTVRGVLENIPENSHLKFDFLTGFETFYSIRGGKEKVESWTSLSYITYIRLSDNADKNDISARLKEFPARFLPKEPFFTDMQWIMVPLKEIHLGGNANFDPGRNSDIRYLYLIISIGIFILLIACFNFMNISTARAFNRGLETAVYKVYGCSKKELIIKFITESLLLSFFGLLIALAIAGCILPFFSVFTERPLTFSMILKLPTLIKVIILTIIVGVISGLYPAICLSSMSPMSLLREEFRNPGMRRRSGIIRNLFVVLQYIISMVALVCTFTLLRQLNYVNNSDLGFIKENILTISLKDPALRTNPDVLVNELKSHPQILNVTLSTDLPNAIWSSTYISWDGKPDGTNMTAFRCGLGNDFIDFYKLNIVSGRGFSADFFADSANSYIINQTAAKMIGLDDPVGKKFGCNGQEGTIIGVIKDFNFHSLKLAVEPLAFSAIGSRDFPSASYLSAKVSPGNLKESRLLIESILMKLSPHYLNPVSVLSENVNANYRSERKLVVIFIIASVISVLLTCLGQYSLSSYTTRSRTKEMVIRKIMGSHPSGITFLLFREIAKWIMISILLAWPVAYMLMNKWLQNFAYHVDQGIGVFLLSLLITLIISIISVSYHILNISRVNPAEMIRRSA
jgi:putative ABC transport system permease protein